jgi:two-component system LytT family response regulator/two-component system response regulator AlgR
MNLRVAVADDEPMNLRRLARLLEEAGCEVVATFQDGDAVIAWAEERPGVDALFLDIRMPGATGLDVLRSLAPPLPVVFVTAHAEHAVEAFDEAAEDYLLKPFTAKRLEKCLLRLKARLASKDTTETKAAAKVRPARYAVKAGEGVVFLDLQKTTHFEVVDEVVWAHAGGRFQTLWKALAEVEAAFPAHRLLRLHRHLLVRLDVIQGVKPLWGGRLQVTLPGGVTLESSRGATQKLKEQLGLARDLPEKE